MRLLNQLITKMKVIFLLIVLPVVSYSQHAEENFLSKKTGDTYKIIPEIFRHLNDSG